MINVDEFIDVGLVEVTGDTHEDELALVPDLKEEGDEVDNPEGAVTGESASEVTLHDAELAEAIGREAFKVEVVDIAAGELDEKVCSEGVAIGTEPA